MTVSRPVAVAVVLLAACLLALNTLLLFKNADLSRRLQAALDHEFVPAGATLPSLSGIDITGKPMEISPAESAPFVILVFNTDCHVCDENWPAWDKLLNDPSIKHSFSFVSFRNDVPKSYLDQHHMSPRTTVIGLDAKVARSYNLVATPQTVLVESGRVVHTWPGALSDNDLSEIRTALTKAMKAS